MAPQFSHVERVPGRPGGHGRGDVAQPGTELLTGGLGEEALDAGLVEPSQPQPDHAVEPAQVGQTAGQWIGYFVPGVAERPHHQQLVG